MSLKNSPQKTDKNPADENVSCPYLAAAKNILRMSEARLAETMEIKRSLEGKISLLGVMSASTIGLLISYYPSLLTEINSASELANATKLLIIGAYNLLSVLSLSCLCAALGVCAKGIYPTGYRAQGMLIGEIKLKNYISDQYTSLIGTCGEIEKKYDHNFANNERKSRCLVISFVSAIIGMFFFILMFLINILIVIPVTVTT